METYQAYETVLTTIDEIKNSGVIVEINIPRSVKEKDKNIEYFNDLIKKYSGDDKINWQLWRNIQFKNVTNTQAKFIFEKRRLLCLAGISFDTGGGLGSLDWEIDWSFKYTKRESESEEHHEACNIVEEMFINFFWKKITIKKINYGKQFKKY